MTALLEVDGLTKRYAGGVLALDHVDLRVEAGSVVGLLGHNGAGKTTLVRLVAGQLHPTAGLVRVAGCDVVARPSAARRLCSVQAQGQVPIDGLTARTAIELTGRLRGGSRTDVRRRTAELAERLAITEWLDRRSRPGEDSLSGGVLRLVSFAMTAVAPAPLVVLDEPTNDVDPVRRRLLWGEIRRLAEAGHAVVLVTHNVVEAERSLDRVVLLHRGRPILDAAPATLLRETAGRLRVDVTFEPVVEAAWPDWLGSVALRGRTLSATFDEDRLPALMAWGAGARADGLVERLAVTTSSLDDVYVRAVDADDRQRVERGAPGDVRVGERVAEVVR